MDEPTRVLASPVIEALARGEIDIQIKTAKAYPRDVRQCRERAIQLATLDEDTAAACMYGLKRGGKVIEGPSVRLAEIIACSWTNLRVAKRLLGEDGRKVTAQAVCHDLETNVAISGDCSRSITNRTGGRFTPDMITVTENAAASVALRNAVFACVPKAIWQPVYEAARAMAVGDASTLGASRAKMIEHFAKMGVDVGQILTLQGRESVEDLTLDDIGLLRGIFSAIKAGETKVDEAFPPATPEFSETAKAKTLDALAELSERSHKPPVSELDPNKVLAGAGRAPSGEPLPRNDQPSCAEETYKAVHTLWMKLSNEAKAPIKKNFDFGMIVDVKKWKQSDAKDLLDHLHAEHPPLQVVA